MKWRIILLMLVICSCKKSLTDEQQVSNSQKSIVGKWRLIQYYRENSNGTGQWLPCEAGILQTVEFTHEGKFLHNENFVIQEQIDRYKFLEPHKILLYSSHSQDSAKYYYQQDDVRELIFNPLCVEYSCMRKWRLE